jgi:adenylate kinase
MRINSPKKPRQNLRDKLTLVILGRSGSGKGTQAKFILGRLGRRGAFYLETGRFLRELVKRENYTTDIAKKIMERGGLVPSWFPAYTWLHELISRGCGRGHLIFDGSPRHPWEAELLDRVMKDHKRPLPLAIYLEVTEKEATRRLLLRRRADDTKLTIRHRMEFFLQYVIPVIRYYEKRGRLICVDGNPSVDSVWRQIDRALSKRLRNKWLAR